jgi:protease-4
MGKTILQSCLIAGCATIAVPIVLGVFLLVVIGSVTSSGINGAATQSFSPGNIREKMIRKGDDGVGTIAVINVIGVIDGNGSPQDGSGMMARVSEQIRVAVEKSDVKAIILQIDSPGGGLTASDLVYNEILQARSKGKHVVSWASSTMASGGYYIAAASDGIMASPTAMIGSIGVIMQHYQISELMERLGVKVDPITSGEHKDLGSMFREMTPEERAFLQETVDHAQNRFVDIVAKGRGMVPDDVRKYADGRIFTAEMALEAGLVDKVGYMDDAISWTEELVGVKGMRVVAYKRVVTFADLVAESGRIAAREATREIVRQTMETTPAAR